MYNKLMAFFQELKKHDEYDVFRIDCNTMAVKVGLLCDFSIDNSMKDNARTNNRKRKAAEGVAALEFDSFGSNIVPGMPGCAKMEVFGV